MRLAALTGLVAILATSPAHAETQPGDTLPVQVRGAGYGLLVGGATGLVSGVLIGAKSSKGDSALAAVMITTTFGMLIGIPIGVQSYADNRGGSGQGWGTAVGSVGGMAAATALVFGMRKSKPSPPEIIGAAVMVLGCIAAGPIIGYRASATGTPNEPPAVTRYTTAFVVPLTINF